MIMWNNSGFLNCTGREILGILRNFCFDFYSKETVALRCSVKNVLLEISQNSQEKTCARVSFLITTLLKKKLWRRCFPVIFTKFLRTPFLTKHLRWLLPILYLLLSRLLSSLIKIHESILEYSIQEQKQPPQVSSLQLNEKETLAQVFSNEFCGNVMNTLFTEHLWETASARTWK